jgi:small GTP-binding protein
MFLRSSLFHCRVVMIGDTSVGKTSILNQLIDHQFNDLEQSTIAANYHLYLDEIDDSKIEIQIWDTAGQERFRSLGPVYYRDALGAVAVYDVSNRRSFENLTDLVASFTDVAGNGPLVTVVGNKCDLPSAAVTRDEATQWALWNSYDLYFTSARSGEGITELFRGMARRLMQKRETKSRREDIEKKAPLKCEC